MSDQFMADLSTFEIGGGSGDINAEVLRFNDDSYTDTLISSVKSELTGGLGNPTMDEYENYMEDGGGVSDIQMQTFDSALINEAGVGRIYTSDDEAIEEEFAKAIGVKIKTKAKATTNEKDKSKPAETKKATISNTESKNSSEKEENRVEEINTALALQSMFMPINCDFGSFDAEVIYDESDNYAKFIVDEIYQDDNGEIMDTEDIFTEADFEIADYAPEEWEAICKEIK